MATASAQAMGARAQAAPLHTVQVVGRVQSARDVVTLWLAAPGTLTAPAPYLPGQFITLALRTSRGGTLHRSYSLCGDGRADRPWEITVKRQRAGVVSGYLYETIQPGMLLKAGGPMGTFTLPRGPRPDTPLVFVALGAGITPIYGMLRALARLGAERRPRVELHYGYHAPEDAIYARELAALDPARAWLTQRHYVSTAGARVTPERVLASAGARSATAEWYICGSADFKRGLEAALVRHGVAPARIHAETFSSPRATPATPAAGAGRAARVRLAESGATLEARPAETLLETLERNGYRPASDCRAGACGTCRLRLLAGRVRDDGGALTPAERAAGYVLSCVAVPQGDVTLAGAADPLAARRSSQAAIGRVAGSPGRRAGRRALRWGLAAASLSVFVGAWTLTQATSAASGQGVSGDDGSAGSSPTATSCPTGSYDNGFGQCVLLPSGASGVTTQPGSGPTHTHSGASR